MEKMLTTHFTEDNIIGLRFSLSDRLTPYFDDELGPRPCEYTVEPSTRKDECIVSWDKPSPDSVSYKKRQVVQFFKEGDWLPIV